MKNYVVFTKTTNRETFIVYKPYELYRYNNECLLYNETSNTMRFTDDESMKAYLEDNGFEFEVKEIPDTVYFFRDNNTGVVYKMDLENIDWEKENAFEDCIENADWNKRYNTAYLNDLREKFNASIITGCNEYDVAYTFLNHHNYNIVSIETYYAYKYADKLVTAKRYPKAELTVQEYNSVFNAITDLLDEYDYSWTTHAINAVIDEWLRNKGELISMFRSHPNYNGNFQIVFSGTRYQIGINKNAGDNFMRWVGNNFDDSSLLIEKVLNGKTYREWEEIYYGTSFPRVYAQRDEVTGKLTFFNVELYEEAIRKREYAHMMIMYFGNKHTDDSRNEYYKCVNTFDDIRKYNQDRIDDDFAKFLNEKFPEFRVREGQKTTKTVGKVMRYYGIDKLAGYSREYAKYCDAINVIDITRHTVLSIHPVDYLTMSFGNSWASCHTIDKENRRGMPDSYEGMYSSGTMSYMLDGSSFVLYTVDSKYEGNTFYECDKINRCMFHAMNERIVQGRCYPQSEDGNDGLYAQFRNLVQKVMSELWDIPNLWTIKRGSSMTSVIDNCGTHYPDYIHFSYCNMSVFKDTNIPHTNGVMKIGHKPICIECGNEHTTSDNINCCREYGHVCPECGAIVDDEYYTEINGERYHDDCVFLCEYHDRYEPNCERWGHVYRYGDICHDAFEAYEFDTCEECDELYHVDDMHSTEGGYVCEYCHNNSYVFVDSLGYSVPTSEATYCEVCQEHFITEDAETDDNGNLICPNCGVVIGEVA